MILLSLQLFLMELLWNKILLHTCYYKDHIAICYKNRKKPYGTKKIHSALDWIMMNLFWIQKVSVIKKWYDESLTDDTCKQSLELEEEDQSELPDVTIWNTWLKPPHILFRYPLNCCNDEIIVLHRRSA